MTFLKNSALFAVILATTALSGCALTTSSKKLVSPAPVTPSAFAPVEDLFENVETMQGKSFTASKSGAPGSPQVNPGTGTIEIDGVTYAMTHIENASAITPGTAFALVLASVGNETRGVGLVGSGSSFGGSSPSSKLLGSNPLASVERFDLVFIGAETPASELPKMLANYQGTYEAVFMVEGALADLDSGSFEMTADFGDQTVSGTYNSSNPFNENNGVLTGTIKGSGFSATVDAGDGITIPAAGMFVGANASGVVGTFSGPVENELGDIADIVGIFEGGRVE